MFRARTCLVMVAVLAGLAIGAGGVALASVGAETAKTHHKKHHKKKKKHHKSSSPKSSSPKSTSEQLEGCQAILSGSGPLPESNLYSYQLIFTCSKGTYGSFQVSTDRTIVAGSITARLGSTMSYSCPLTSSSSASCSGVTATIPSGEPYPPAVRVSFKSSQAPCTAPIESATVTAYGKTYTATRGEAGITC